MPRAGGLGRGEQTFRSLGRTLGPPVIEDGGSSGERLEWSDLGNGLSQFLRGLRKAWMWGDTCEKQLLGEVMGCGVWFQTSLLAD